MGSRSQSGHASQGHTNRAARKQYRIRKLRKRIARLQKELRKLRSS